MIYYTIYTSTPTGKVTQEVVDQITQESIKWNSEHGVTGILLCLEDKFFQVLEGEQEDVDELFEMIRKDTRHRNVVPRIKGFTKERVFSDWSMGSWMLSNEDLTSLTGLKDLNDYLLDPSDYSPESTRLYNMMNNILNTWLAHEPERSNRLKG